MLPPEFRPKPPVAGTIAELPLSDADDSLLPGEEEAPKPSADWRRDVPSVSQFVRRIRGHLEGTFSDVWVRGEISNYRPSPSGHCYFVLKDASAQLPAVFFRNITSRLKFRLENGLELLVRGRVTYYEAGGRMQMICEAAEPAGIGALQLAFDQLKARLAAEGLFAAERKKPLPFLPRRVALITSPTGAVVRDMLTVFARRAPQVSLLVLPVAVQGDKAVPDLVEAFARLGRWNESAPASEKVDLVIFGRGGGSMEDLWAFNDERLARAVIACTIPTISAVGHETDFTIADFVADRRAPTPSAAAEMAAPSREELFRQVAEYEGRLARSLRRVVDQKRLHVTHLTSRLVDPRERLQQLRERCRDLLSRATFAIAQSALLKRRRLETALGRLHAFSPLATLGRGYSITFGADGLPLTSATAVAPGSRLTTRLADGTVESQVTAISKGPAPSMDSL
jgi:exodeoxyribonuclease VII large subunit